MPDDAYAIPFGEANVTREGDDVTIVAIGRMVNFANQVADNLKKDEIACTVVDPRTTSPLDTETILETASRRPAASSSSTKPTRAATWRPTSRR